MTTEEAIEQLENLEKCETYLWSKDIQAIDIAVKALEENKELIRLLKLAVDDFERFRCLMSSVVDKDFCETALEYYFYPNDLCNSCPLSGSAKCQWKHADEAMKLIGEE